MSVGSVGKWLSMGLLVASLGAVGCGDDDEKKDAGGGGTPDSGGDTPDAGGGEEDSGSLDAGSDAAPQGCPDNPGAMNACCGPNKDMLCTPFMQTLQTLGAGCALDALDAEVCGVSSALLSLGDAGPRFVEKNATGASSPSCAAFYDQLERGADGGVGQFRGNGVIDSTRMFGATTFLLRYQGCCTKAGLCTVNGQDGGVDTQGTGTYGPSDNGYGCLNPAYAFGAYPTDAGPALGNLNLRAIPCDPGTGMIKVTLPSPDAGATDASADAAGG